MNTITSPTDIWQQPPNRQESSPFFNRLPLEVRENIFCWALAREPRDQPWIHENTVEDGRLYTQGHYGRASRRRNPSCMNLLLVCKRWHDEITPLVYRNVHLRLHPHTRAETRLFRTHPNYLRYLRTMLIEFEDTPVCQESLWPGPAGTPRFELIAERVAEIVRLCKQGGIDLRRVDLLAPWHGVRPAGWAFDLTAEASIGSERPSDTTTSVDIEPLLADPTLFSTLKAVTFIGFASRFATRASSPLNLAYHLTPAQMREIVERLGFQTYEDKSSTRVFALRNPDWVPRDTNPEFVAHKSTFRLLVDQHDQKLRDSQVEDP